MQHTKDTLQLIGRQQAGISDKAVETRIKDQAVLDKLKADQFLASGALKAEATPTFFINGGRVRAAMSFDELDQRIRSVLKRRIPRIPSRPPRKPADLAALQRS